MAFVPWLLFLSLRVFLAQAETINLISDLQPGGEFKRCLKVFDWERLNQEDDIVVLDRDAASGCCPSGYTPGTQPLVNYKQTDEGVIPVLYLYGAVTCGWRNGSFGKIGNKPISIGEECDYGSCYFLPQNFTCNGGRPPFLNGCCGSAGYGETCRRGYYFEDINGQKQDDLLLHMTCAPRTGPGWLDGNGLPIHCEIDIGMEACNTRSTLEWLDAADYAGTPSTEDDVFGVIDGGGGVLQPWNLLGARYCPPTTSTTTPGINDTTTWWEFALRADACEETQETLQYELLADGRKVPINCSNVTIVNTTTTTVTTTSGNTTVTTTTITYTTTPDPRFTTNTTTQPTTTTSTFSSSTTNTTTTTSERLTSTNTSSTTSTSTTTSSVTSTSGKGAYVTGQIIIAVDDAVVFALSGEVQAAMRELVAELTGFQLEPYHVDATVSVVTSDTFALSGGAGGRRLFGLVTVDFSVLVPIDAADTAVENLQAADMEYASKRLAHFLNERDRSDLSGSIHVQQISAEKGKVSTTTSSDILMGCSETQLCFSQSCGSCHNWRSQGLVCQEQRTDEDGVCLCSCYEETGNRTKEGKATATSRSSHKSLHFGAFSMALLAVCSLA